MDKALPIKARWAVLSLACVALLFTGATYAEGKPDKKHSLAGTTWSGTISVW